MLEIELTDEQRQALDENDGFVRGPSYVLMSLEVFRRTMSAEDEAEERRITLQAVDEAMTDLEAGRTIPAADVFRALDEKHGLSR